MYKHLNKVKEVASANKLTITETEIHKITSKKTFIDDAIKLIKVMLMINYMKDKPPYISGNKYIWEDVRSLKASWEKQK